MELVDEKKRLPVKPLQEVETSNTTQTVESSYHPEIFHTRVCCVYYPQLLFEGGVYFAQSF